MQHLASCQMLLHKLMCSFCNLVSISEMKYKHVNWKHTTSVIFCSGLRTCPSKEAISTHNKRQKDDNVESN